MSDDYDDYNYEDGDIEKKAVTKKRIIIVTLLIVAIILVIVLLKSCGTGGKDKGDDTTNTFDYEKTLLDAGKKYYEYNEHKMPSSIGECTSVDLDTLGNQYGLVNVKDFEKCDNTNTLVNVCMLEDGSFQWTPWLSCTDKDSNSEYDTEKEGTAKNLVEDESYVSFMFLPQVLKEGTENLGKEEEYWKTEIPYSTYKTVSSITYYSYKDQMWIWNTISKTYYSRTGDKTNANEVADYYTSSPNSKYNLSDSKATAYKWYTEESTKKEYYMSNGAKAWSMTAPEGYPYKGTDSSDAKIVDVYRTRTITENKNALYYYRCKTSSSSDVYVDQQVPCSNSEGKNTQNPAYTFTAKTFWNCPAGSYAESTTITEGTLCHVYSEWSKVTTTSCGANSILCQHGTATFYAWYRLVGDGKRTYYPSGSSTASGENVYYVNSPVNGAIKDTSTAAAAYKWYFKTEGQTSTYLSASPGAGATKTEDTKYSDWSEWSATKPASQSYRTIQSKIKIKLRQILGTTDDDWSDLSDDYLTEEELIGAFVKAGYEVESLTDITNNGTIRYKVKMYIRNKKEATTNE